jgi:hypothetical protein
MLDDDIVILDSCNDALEAFASHDLVYTPDQDMGSGYLGQWGHVFGCSAPLPTARFNAGLYWIRDRLDKRRLAAQAVRGRSCSNPCDWEQGLIAVSYARQRTHSLHPARYLFVLLTGLPGGILGYDYANNPCGFASVHYGGMRHKPTDAAAVEVARQILERRRNVVRSAAQSMAAATAGA